MFETRFLGQVPFFDPCETKRGIVAASHRAYQVRLDGIKDTEERIADSIGAGDPAWKTDELKILRDHWKENASAYFKVLQEDIRDLEDCERRNYTASATNPWGRQPTAAQLQPSLPFTPNPMPTPTARLSPQSYMPTTAIAPARPMGPDSSPTGPASKYFESFPSTPTGGYRPQIPGGLVNAALGPTAPVLPGTIAPSVGPVTSMSGRIPILNLRRRG